MAKELPYFKFNTGEWLTGNIVFESLEIQGAFINVCALYWHRGGVITLKEVEQRIKKKSAIEALKNKFILVKPDGFISVSFLDEQLSERESKAENSRENGKKGGRPKKTGQVILGYKNKPRHNPEKPNKEKEEEKEEEKEKDNNSSGDKSPSQTIEERKSAFYNSLIPFIEKYSKETIRAFFDHWSEHSPNGKKMRWEMEKVFAIEKRLTTWKRNENNFKSFGRGEKKSKFEQNISNAMEAAANLEEKYKAEENEQHN